MEFDLPPWYSGADRPERVLERALGSALERPEVTRAVVTGLVTRDELIDALAGARTAVLAAASQAEQRYRDERPGWYARFEVNAPVGRWVLLVTPVFGLTLLAWALAELLGWSGVAAFGLIAGTAAVAIAFDLLLLLNWSEGRFSLGVGRVWAAWGWFLPTLAFASMVGALSATSQVVLLVAAPVASLLGYLTFRTLLRSFRHAGQGEVARAALRAWEDSVLVDGVLPVLYSRLNEVTPPVHSATLTAREVSSLVRADPLRMHVPTPAGAVLAGLVDRLDGGSFAVAGPRGAGKTSLLLAFCGGRYRAPGRAPDLAVLVSAPVDYVPHEFVVHLFAEVCEAVIERFGQRDGRRWRKVRPHPLVSVARDHLTALDYVRSHTDEVSGKGGVKGFELAGKRAVTLTGRPLTYPEVVKRFRVFLGRIAAEQATERVREPGRVVIGIDELDRIGTGEPARRLLNEIKAVFDVQGCYYLVSVSTTVTRTFTADLTADRLRTLDLDGLARARRYAGTNPDAGLALLRDLDRTWAA
ncbi:MULTISPECIES: hypothetical protein [Saccharothrix]|uniref:hypothetical protein n=1 Tax=Saccharothrix TaxID=2071 RepID=UPI00093E42E8|nr:hypothetical protein [Saccharothrix sp. CB00851]OKI39305.1 hypothetical protein A6A25_03905 [Saccharothrix sp. CB00851]